MLIPRLESLVAGKDGKVILAKIDIDEHTDLAMDYEVRKIASDSVSAFQQQRPAEVFTKTRVGLIYIANIGLYH